MPRQSNQDENKSSSRRKAPPNYFSRRVQMRLFLLVGCFMLVVFLMEEARKPKYYRWMWGQQAEGEVVDGDPDEVDTRIPAAAKPNPGPADAIEFRKPTYDDETLEKAGEQKDDPLGRAAIDAWGRMLGELTLEQRREFNRAFWLRRQDKRSDPEQLQILSQAISVFQETLNLYLQNARQSLIGDKHLEEDQLAAWQAVLDQLEQKWARRWKPALNGLFESPDPNPDNAAALLEIQALVDELDIAAIRDNAIARPSEWNAWFRFIERLRTEDPDDLREQSIGVVGFLQLHKQPKDYRGKVVTIRGQVRLGYRVTAPKNIYGVKEYNLLWLRPRGGPNTLVAVYCLEAPGLPKLKHKDLDGGVTELEHDIEVTGYFFKKWAYRARDGVRTAPKILAKAAVVESNAGWSSTPVPNSQMLTIVTLVAVFVGLILGLVFLNLNQWPSRTNRIEGKDERLGDFNQSQVSLGVSHELRQLAAEEAANGAAADASANQPRLAENTTDSPHD